MNWDTVVAICEIVSAIAIVVTLFYLARQLRQNTQTIKSATWQSTQDAEQRFDEMIASNSAVADLFDRGMRGGIDSLQGAERTQFSLIHKQLLDLYQAGDGQHEQIARACDVGRERLAEMQRQRDELDVAMDELKQQLAWGEQMLASIERPRAAAE